MNRPVLIVALAILCTPVAAFALDDTPENRAAQIDRYLRVAPPSEMLDEMATQVAKTMPESQQETYRKLMHEYVDVDALTDAMRESMLRHFTADELKAIADLYESPVGKSAMSKMGAYMADVMPVIMSEVRKAMAQLQEDEQASKESSD
jgi:hypothetical protein